MFRHPAIVLTVSALLFGSAGAARAQWKQVGYLRAESRNLSIGNGVARVVSTPKFRDLYTEGYGNLDTAKANAMYPGWDKHSDIVVTYTLTDKGFVQTDWDYGQNVEEHALKGDTISTSLSIFDQQGKRRAKIPASLRRHLPKDAAVVAATHGNLDADPDSEWAIVVAGPWDSKIRGALNNVSLFNKTGNEWQLLKVFKLKGPRRAGPIEIRDVTGDGHPDVIYRSFVDHFGYFFIEANIFSDQPNLPEVDTPPEFDPNLKQAAAN